jgi:type IV secretion system protein TrbI
VIGTRAVPPPDGPDRSPAMLAPPPRRGAGVRRLNRMPLVIGGGACVVAAAIGYTYHERAMQAAANAQRDAEHKAEPASGASILNGAPANGEIRSAAYRAPMPPHPATLQPEPLAAMPPSDHADGSPAQGDDDATKARREAWRNYYGRLAQLQKDRLTAAQSAMTADTSGGSHNQQIVAASAGGAAAPAAAGAGATQGLPGASGGAPGYGGVAGVPGVYDTGAAGYPIYPPAQIDTAGQREKQAFLAQPGATGDADYLQASRRDRSRLTR